MRILKTIGFCGLAFVGGLTLLAMVAVAVWGRWIRAVRFHDLLGPPPGSPRTDPPQPLWGEALCSMGPGLHQRGVFEGGHVSEVS
jgi:hypothetical protein